MKSSGDDPIFKEDFLKDSNSPASQPVFQSSGIANYLVRLREQILNRLSGVNQSLIINSQVADGPISPSTDLAVRLKSTLTDLKSTVMDPTGTSVDYAALRDSTAYAEYQREYHAALRQFNPKELKSLDEAKSFWINLYNALILDAVIAFDIQESVTEGVVGILTFFRRAAYMVGGRRVSLEDMEHGILRGNRGNPYVPGVHFSSDNPLLDWSLPLDPRIHFALNCGGRSCPPIRAYEADKLDQQLALAARGFVDATVTIDPERNEIRLSQIFRWYSADFGGQEGIIQFLKNHLPDDERRQFILSRDNKIRFAYTPYDWSLNVL